MSVDPEEGFSKSDTVLCFMFWNHNFHNSFGACECCHGIIELAVSYILADLLLSNYYQLLAVPFRSVTTWSYKEFFFFHDFLAYLWKFICGEYNDVGHDLTSMSH